MTIRLRERIQAELPSLVELRRDLHAHPELGYEERRTSALVQRELAAAGVEHLGGLAGGTGVLGLIGGRDGARAVALRADMDALPIVEATGLPWSSRYPGVMHACGHDGHTTILLGAARVLAGIAREQGGLPQPVALLFQPAEEGGAGARRMVEDGCLDGSRLGPPVEGCYGLHGWPTLPLGHVAARAGAMMAAVAIVEIEIEGRGSHAAAPHHGRDPVLAAASLILALQQIASRNVDPVDPGAAVVVSITRMVGGDAFNIIPDRVRLTGTVRALSEATRALARERLHTITEHIVAAHGCTARVSYDDGYPVQVNDAGAVEIVASVARQVGEPVRFERLEAPVMLGEDFAFYGEVVPSCFFHLGLQAAGAPPMALLHQARFDFNDEALGIGIEMFCRLALRESSPASAATGLAP